ncbi:hypothetical protein TBLA_0A03920 [Henningerozyma blattae CBS 6284]|uniref:Cullin family profile domain-containing protein n=1 Tax=Henningerozyma blattae (strain ATCC 34711 / CBS 6284 / DSM 70876 / NBRC 10599 / NRRL Y-10934 / UCD 77-7) TaxID=1071380 RepID=I2GVN8_HENB6|nr:hypothetical protein TBLA_0A03920 [Tetrapisispora blattae CBS 6284]CCH58190.1 hypothetical protein TBLA_0A03920 [Tetrapisispora blattae CBS 6284]
MSLINELTLTDIKQQLKESSKLLSPYKDISDELETLLIWLDPNDPNSNHHLHPPTLQLKTIIKQITPSSDIYKDPSNSIKNNIQNWLKLFYVYQVRTYFFKKIDNIRQYKDMIKLEKYYQFPLQFIPLFTFQEWCFELLSLRHYILHQNKEFTQKIILELRQLIKEEDFETSLDIVTWIREVDSNLLSENFILDILLEKITLYCEQTMKGNWTRRYLVMETYNTFMMNYWLNFTQLLNCKEDNHKITNILFKYFEKQFIKIRIQEIFKICILSYPDTKPTLLELRNLLVTYNFFQKLVVNFLSAFERIVLTPTINTIDCLLAYIRTVKSFQILDPSGRYLYSITNYINPHFRERKMLAPILLHAILALPKIDLENAIYPIKVSSISLKLIINELEDPELGIENTSTKKNSIKKFNEILSPKRFNNHNSSEYLPDLLQNTSSEDSNSTLLVQKVVKQFLTWVPIPNDIATNDTKKLYSSTNLLDILLNIFESKEFLLTEFSKLLSKRLLITKNYKLEGKWGACLQLLRKRFSSGSDNYTNTNLADTDNLVNGENLKITNMNVMLSDLNYSSELCKIFHHANGVNTRVYPKFISSHYWVDLDDENVSNGPNEETNHFQIPPSLLGYFEEYAKLYEDLNEGRKVDIWPNEGVIEIKLSFEDGRVLEIDATLPQYALLQYIQEKNAIMQNNQGFTVNELSVPLNLSLQNVTELVDFWLKKNVLKKVDDKYSILEYK